MSDFIPAAPGTYLVSQTTFEGDTEPSTWRSVVVAWRIEPFNAEPIVAFVEGNRDNWVGIDLPDGRFVNVHGRESERDDEIRQAAIDYMEFRKEQGR